MKTKIWEKHTHATIVTLHLFKLAIWEDTWKLTFQKNHTLATIVTLHLFNQAIWEDVWKSFNGEISHICNYCDFASVQSGDLRRHVKTSIWENHTHATNVTLHLFKQAIWEHVWKHTIEEMTNMQLMWEHMWKSIFEKMTHMQLMWLCIC